MVLTCIDQPEGNLQLITCNMEFRVCSALLAVRSYLIVYSSGAKPLSP
jgi:hypothetical protein